MSEPIANAVPAIEGWFTTDPNAPALIGSRCVACSSVYFPVEMTRCRNPHCGGETLETTQLSRRGTVWSVTSASYAPPAPYIVEQPFEPYAIVAVELEKEKMVVLGQAAKGVGPRDLKAGDAVELVLERAYAIDGVDQLIWKFRPVTEEGSR